MSEPEVSPPVVDARGKPCPMPIVMLARALKDNEAVWLWADDPAVEADLRSFCAATGNQLVGQSAAGRLIKALVRRRTEGSHR